MDIRLSQIIMVISISLGLSACTVGNYKIGVFRDKAPMPVELYSAPADHPVILDWRKRTGEHASTVVTANVVSEDQDTLFVYVDYIYSGEAGDQAFACGSISSKHKGHVWTCSPASIYKGRSFAVLRMGLNYDLADDSEFSDYVGLTFYGRDGNVFYTAKYPFKKKWEKRK